jgi:two-component system, NarL family, sensor kinase
VIGVLLALVGGLTTVGWWLVGSPGRDAPNLAQAGFLAAVAVSGTALGALILRHRPGHGVGRVLLAMGVLGCGGVLALGWSGWGPAGWLAQWVWWPALGLVPVALLLFPDGRLPARSWRPLLAGLVAAVVVGSVALAAAVALSPSGVLLDLSVPATGTARLLLRVASVAVLVSLLGALGALAALVWRWRRATALGRRQLLCLVLAAAVLLIGHLLELFGLPVAWLVQGAALPVAMTLAVLRFGLLDLDVVLNRATLWLTMTALVLFGYVALVEIASRLLRPDPVLGADRVAVLLLAGLVAITVEPLRRLVQRGVDRLFFGHRDDPYAVISALGGQLTEVVDPAQVLPRLTEEVTRALQVPYAAVEISGAGPEVVACCGRRLVTPQPFDMVVHGVPVGRLLVSPRRHGERFTGIERRLLTDLARQAATAVQVYLLTLDLRRSRERLVLAREEERRRLRVDLHDGLGPGLLGTALQVRATRQQLARDSAPAAMLDQVADDLASCAQEAFRLVDELRPAALDQGLAEALRQEAARFSAGRLRVTVGLPAPAELGPLPAAVEVAVYRIVAEALANVARHSGAQRCRVSLCRGDRLELTIEDDGTGRRSAAGLRSAMGTDSRGGGGGTGLDSMRTRAEELGGTFALLDGTRSTSGLRIVVTLPIGESAGRSAGPARQAPEPLLDRDNKWASDRSESPLPQ